MKWLLLSLVILAPAAAAQPADCPAEGTEGPSEALPLAIELAGRPGVPSGVSGQAFLAMPLERPGYSCGNRPLPDTDVLHGQRGDVLRGPAAGDLLRDPGTPRVRIEIR